MTCHTKETSSSACPVDPSCLGMCSWTNCPGNADSVNFEPHPISSGSEPLPLTSCKLQPASHLERFAVVTDQELAKLTEGLTPLNTAKTTMFGFNFNAWFVITLLEEMLLCYYHLFKVECVHYCIHCIHS